VKKSGGKGKSASGGKKKRTPGSPRKKATRTQRLLLILFGFILLAALELAVRLVPAGIESAAESDPFVGFSAIHPLFVSYRAGDGSLRMKTAPGKLRWFNPQDFAARKEPGTFRIFSLGGSTTYGRPYKDATSFSGWLRILLSRISGPSKRYEVINAGGISYASYRVITVLEELLAYEPDLFIVYTGHNEFLEARTYGEYLDGSGLGFKAREAFSRLKLYRLLARTIQSIKEKVVDSGVRSDPNLLSPEVQTILDRSAGLDLYRRDTVFSRGVFEHFHYNLAKMKSLCRQAGVPVVFLEPVDNIKDFSPFKSQGRDDLDSRSRERLAGTLSEGFRLLGEKRYQEGIQRFKEAVAVDSLSAESFFYLGRAYLAAGDTSSAVEYLLRARELDVCPLRAQEPIHRILRQETVGTYDPDLLDLPGLFRQLSPGGLIGGELLVDHIHPRPEGNLRIALELLAWMGEEGFVGGSYFPAQDELEDIYSRVIDSLSPEYFRQGIINLAKVLIWANKYAEALNVLGSRWELLSEEGEARYLAGTALLELGAAEEALEHFQKALELAPDHLMVLLKIAPLYSRLGEVDSSMAVYQRGLKHYPDNTLLLADYALLLSHSGRTDEALDLLQRVRSLDPEAPGLDSNFGNVYARAGRNTKAIEAFRKAIEAAPGDPEAYYNLGNLYAGLQRPQEAEKYFLETIKRNPQHLAAHINLGNIYENTGRQGLAEEEFRLALRMNPNLEASYVNLARLYRTTGRLSMAREVLELGLQRFPGDSMLIELRAGSGLE